MKDHVFVTPGRPGLRLNDRQVFQGVWYGVDPDTAKALEKDGWTMKESFPPIEPGDDEQEDD